MSAFDPDPDEWAILDVAFITALVPWIIWIASAIGFRWRSWWSQTHLAHPNLIGHPIFFASVFFIVYSLAAVGWWLGWREGHRSDNAPPDPSSGTVPSNTNFFVFNIFYLIFWILSLGSGPMFFGVSLEFKMMAVSCVLVFLIFGCSVILTIFGWMIWFVPGILFLIATIFLLWAFIAVCWYYREFKCEHVHSPFEALEIISINVNQENRQRMVYAPRHGHGGGGGGGGVNARHVQQTVYNNAPQYRVEQGAPPPSYYPMAYVQAPPPAPGQYQQYHFD